MNRRQLEHMIEEVGHRTELEYFYIIGAAAVLAELPKPTEAALIQTRDVDVVPGTADASEEDRIANQIDWVLGEGSDFRNRAPVLCAGAVALQFRTTRLQTGCCAPGL